jgi:hypothetical protein
VGRADEQHPGVCHGGREQRDHLHIANASQGATAFFAVAPWLLLRRTRLRLLARMIRCHDNYLVRRTTTFTHR